MYLWGPSGSEILLKEGSSLHVRGEPVLFPGGQNTIGSGAPIIRSIHCLVFLPFMKPAAELGECELPEHTPELVSEFRFIPNQTEAMEYDIFQRWKECRYLLIYALGSIYKHVLDSLICEYSGSIE